MNIIMLGVEHQLNDELALRAGWNWGNSPIDSDNTFANTLFPGTTEHHFTLGSTYAMDAFEFGVSGYMTLKNTQTDGGSGGGYSRMGKGTWISHRQYGGQLSAKYNF